MKIVKASAGSGKTFTLAGTYIRLLLDSPDRYAYRHILAVTFTNKATAEMKSRILRDLLKEARDNPKAMDILTDILHDYSAFAVSTIDKFFQMALKSFSREIGQFSAYQLELDRDSLVDEAMDRILDSLTEDKTELVEWIKESVRDRIEAGERYNFDDSLHEIGHRLKTEEFRELSEASGMTGPEAFGKERLAAIHKACREIIDDFTTRASGFGIRTERSEKIKMPGKRALAADAALAALFDRPYDIYSTVWEIDKQTYNLGLAGEFLKEFDALMKEKNLMCLDESNTILRDIIDGSDAPFVYEKLGVRYEHFLLDEFQDTSNIQWENFLPLLRESESNGGKSLIVGDVKQSIYRWRDSDWNLLDSRVAEEFPAEPPVSLDSNWRSCGAIVRFNNGFFRYAAGIVGASDIYSDVSQKIKAKDGQDGRVRVSFTDDQQEAVIESIGSAREAGAQWGDIAVLVRNRKQGAELAGTLIEKGIPVISDDSLRLKSSLTVRRLVSLLAGFDNPIDEVSRFLSSNLEVEWPEQYFSLYDLSENLLRQLKTFDPATAEGEVLFIQAFMDDVKTWSEANGNNLGQFLKHWEESDLYIGSPDNASSVRILTIHKSKGLEFPYLIFPYAEKVGMYKAGVHWCRLRTDGTPLPRVLDGIYPVYLGSDSPRTLFADDYWKERRMQQVDNLNVFYVALTRASKVLHVIAANPSKKCQESVRKGHPEFGNFAEILFAYTGGMSDFTTGEGYDFSIMEREEEKSGKDFEAHYDSIPLGNRLQPSAEAGDFFGEDGVTGPAASPRLDGIVLHGILSAVRNASDLRPAVDGAVLDGVLAKQDADKAFDLLSARIGAHPEWFGTEETVPDVNVLNENTVFGPDGKCYRPDRVIDDGNAVTVIDYKFGEERKSYENQVREYMELYRMMGRESVRGAIWYVREDKVFGV